jgi:hypothetical protein
MKSGVPRWAAAIGRMRVQPFKLPHTITGSVPVNIPLALQVASFTGTDTGKKFYAAWARVPSRLASASYESMQHLFVVLPST